MILRNAHIHALTDSQHQGFVTRLMAHFQRLWPEKVAALVQN
jgi:hypothetical protein